MYLLLGYRPEMYFYAPGGLLLGIIGETLIHPMAKLPLRILIYHPRFRESSI